MRNMKAKKRTETVLVKIGLEIRIPSTVTYTTEEWDGFEVMHRVLNSAVADVRSALRSLNMNVRTTALSAGIEDNV